MPTKTIMFMFLCNVCNMPYTTFEEAEKCEKRLPSEKPRYHVGQILHGELTADNEIVKSEIKILKVRFGVGHFPIYDVEICQKGPRKKHKNTLSLAEYELHSKLGVPRVPQNHRWDSTPGLEEGIGLDAIVKGIEQKKKKEGKG